MGGHGGLNILPQKRWNVYRYDNRAKVAFDEAEDKRQRDEAEQKVRKKGFSERVNRLRDRQGLEISEKVTLEGSPEKKAAEHVNLFGEIETFMAEAKAKHQKYLREIGHDERSAVSVKVAALDNTVPWYMRPRVEEEKEEIRERAPLPVRKNRSRSPERLIENRASRLQRLRRERLQREADAQRKRQR